MKDHLEILLVLLALASSLLPAMWDEAVNFTYGSSYIMSNYPEAARWLVHNLGDNELAIVPSSVVFEALEPELKGRIIPFSDIWKGAGVFLAADNTIGHILAVRRYLAQYLRLEKIGYILVSRNDPYSARLFEGEIQDELVLLKIIEFHSESLFWNDPVTVYEFTSTRREIFNLTLSAEPAKYHTNGNINLSFNESGMAIHYEGEVGVYIPIFVNSSTMENLLLTVYLKEMSLGAKGNVVVYLDKDGDGRWGGWDVDTGVLIEIPQKPPLRNEILLSQKIYKISYNIIQVGIVLYGTSPEAITVDSIIFYEI